MTTVERFGIGVVPRPSASETIKAELLTIAEQFLAEVRAGEVTEVVMIIKHPTTQWSNRWSGSLDYPRTIGELEITKHEMIANYSRDSKKCD